MTARPSVVAVDQTAAETAIRSAARRLGAPRADLDQVLAVLFSPTGVVMTGNGGLSRRRVTASATDRARIRELLAAKRDSVAIASEVGCSLQTVNAVRAGLGNARRKEAR